MPCTSSDLVKKMFKCHVHVLTVTTKYTSVYLHLLSHCLCLYFYVCPFLSMSAWLMSVCLSLFVCLSISRVVHNPAILIPLVEKTVIPLQTQCCYPRQLRVLMTAESDRLQIHRLNLSCLHTTESRVVHNPAILIPLLKKAVIPLFLLAN